MLRAVIFDFNGVILNDEPIHMMMFQKVLSGEDIALSRDSYYAHYLGMDDAGCFKTVYSDVGRKITADKLDSLIEKKSELYDQYIKDHMEFFPKSVYLVQQASREFKTAIVSGALKHEIEFALKKAKIHKEIHVMVAQEDVENGKPDPEGYLKALELLNKQIGKKENPLLAAECLVIEDSLEGIHSAREAGMKVAGVAHTYEQERLTLEADWVFERIEDISLKELAKHF